MKKILVVLCIVLTAVIFLNTRPGQAVGTAKIYYADRRMHRLVPVETQIKTADVQGCAEQVMKKIVLGRNSDEIIRYIPKDSKISVKIYKNAACVDLTHEMAEKIPKNRENEQLFVYQIVNSLTSIHGIDSVTFTVDGKKSEKFMGFLNMREIFVPDYDI